MSKPAFHLAPHERDSATWQKLQAHYTAKLAMLRAKVENPLETETVRLGLCWRIKEIKELLDLGTEPKPSETQQDAG